MCEDYRSDRAHKVVVGGVPSPDEAPQFYPRGSYRERWENAEQPGLEGKQRGLTERVTEDRRVFGITGDWSIAVLDTWAWYNTV